MTSFYYGISPYSSKNNKKSFIKKRKYGLLKRDSLNGVRDFGLSRYGSRSFGERTSVVDNRVGFRSSWKFNNRTRRKLDFSSEIKSFLGFGKRTTATLSNSLVKTGEAVKEGTSSLQQALETAKNIKGGKMEFEVGPVAIIFSLSAIAVTMSLLYLTHYNSVATKGYDLRRLEADRQQLMTQHDIKNMKLAEVKSLSVISESERVSRMRRPSEVSFVQGSMAIASL